jgi:hypothetical protein
VNAGKKLRTQVLPVTLARASARILTSNLGLNLGFNLGLDEVRSKMKAFSKTGGDAHDRKQ